MAKIFKTTFKVRRGLAEIWTQYGDKVILAEGEPGYELDTHKLKIGDGKKNWNELPLSENLNLIMFRGEKNGVTYGYELAKEAHIPKIENGYYIFEDRSSESKDSTDDKELFNRYSFNFSIAIYDCDTNKLYYFEFDT